MRVREQDENGDYVFGQGAANFLVNSPAAVAQLVETGLRLLEGEWFLDKTVGMPWLQKVIGPAALVKPFYDLAIQNQILNTVGVTSIASYTSNLNTQTRQLTVNATVNTQYGTSDPIVVAVPLGG